jgi:hypothetical protein
VEPAAASAAFDWGKTGLDGDSLQYVTAKGFKDIPSVVGSYRNLEKLHGVPADRLLKVPGPDAKPEEIAAYRERLGMPKDPKEYKLAKFDAGSEAEQANFEAFLRSTFHGLGAPANLVEGFSQKWAEFVTGAQTAAAKARQDQQAAEEAELKGKMGTNYEKFVNVAKQAGDAFGLKAEHIDALEEAIGFKATMTFLNSVGAKLGEAKFAGGGDGAFGGYNVEAARAEISRLRNDPGFAKKLMDKDSESQAKWNRLHLLAYPEQAA